MKSSKLGFSSIKGAAIGIMLGFNVQYLASAMFSIKGSTHFAMRSERISFASSCLTLRAWTGPGPRANKPSVV
jgi:hypothetical protein